MRRTHLTVFLLILSLFLPLIGWTFPAQAQAAPLVYSSFEAIGQLVDAVGGDAIDHRLLVKDTDEIHGYRLSDEDREGLAEAKLFVVNGTDLEKDLIEEVRESFPDLEILVLAQGIDKIKVGDKVDDYVWRGDFDFGDGEYFIDFGHTHEKGLRISFIKDAPSDADARDLAGREAMGQEAERIPQREIVEVSSGKAYLLELAHEAGTTYFRFPEPGKYTVFADYVNGDTLPYVFVDPQDATMEASESYTKSEEELSFNYNPYTWISFDASRNYIRKIQRSLIAIAPEAEEAIKDNRKAVNTELKEIANDFRRAVGELAVHDFIDVEGSLSYLARESHLHADLLSEMLGIQSYDEEVSDEAFEAALEDAKTEGIQCIVHTGELPAVATRMAEALGAHVLQIEDLSQANEAKKGYAARMKELCDRLLESLAKEPKTAGESQASADAPYVPTKEHEGYKLDDVYLEDWEGSWNNLTEYLDDEGLVASFERIAESANKTVEEVKQAHQEKLLCEFNGLVIEDQHIRFTAQFPEEDGPVMYEGDYLYDESYRVKHGRFDMEWHVFRTEDPDARYPILLMMPIHGEESLTHFHLRYGTDLYRILESDGWYPTLIKPSATTAQIAMEIIG